MATPLTSSYSKVAEKEMGYWYSDDGIKLGTLYLRTYAKFNSDNNIDLQARVYNNGNFAWSGNCYATLQGETIKNNVRLDFTARSEIVLGTKTVPGGTVNAIATFRCYGLGLSNTFTVQAEITLPTDKATGLDFDIGSATIITVTRYNENYTRTVVASIGDYTETLMEKGTETQISWQPNAEDLYKQVPDSNIGTITLTTTTHDGDAIIGTQESTLKCRVTESNPVITEVVVTDSLSLVAEDVLVRYLSKPKISIEASGVNYSEIASYTVAESNTSEITSSTSEITLENTIKTNSFIVTVVDKRGNSTTATVSADKFVEYVLPAVSKLDLIRTGEGLDQIQATISGVWYNKEINGTNNLANFKYRYKTSDGEYSDYIDINDSPSETQFTVDTLLSPDNGFDVNSIYTIEVVIIDNLTKGNLTSPIGKAIPLIDHWNENDKDYYNINAEIQQYGKTVYQEDTGYITAELSSDFKPYQDNIGNTPQYRKRGKLVEIRGVVSPKSAQEAGWDGTIFTLPEGFRPSFAHNRLCQGSGANKWLLAVNIDGTVTLARYSGDSNVNIPATAWLHFHDVFMVD